MAAQPSRALDIALPNHAIQSLGDAVSTREELQKLHSKGYATSSTVCAAAVTEELWAAGNGSPTPTVGWDDPMALSLAVLPPPHLLPHGPVALREAEGAQPPARAQYLAACACVRHDPDLRFLSARLQPTVVTCLLLRTAPICTTCGFAPSSCDHRPCPSGGCLGSLSLNRVLYWLAGMPAVEATSHLGMLRVLAALQRARQLLRAITDEDPWQTLDWLLAATPSGGYKPVSFGDMQEQSRFKEYLQDLELHRSMTRSRERRVAEWLHRTCLQASVTGPVPSMDEIASLVRAAAHCEASVTPADLWPYQQVLARYHDTVRAHHDLIRRMSGARTWGYSHQLHARFMEWSHECNALLEAVPALESLSGCMASATAELPRMSVDTVLQHFEMSNCDHLRTAASSWLDIGGISTGHDLSMPIEAALHKTTAVSVREWENFPFFRG